MENVDILQPPTFNKSGKVKTIVQAWEDGDWIGTFNLWIIKKDPVPSIVYQQRSPNSSWAPNMLDVTAGGHLVAGESIIDGLREVKEELNKEYSEVNVIYLGRKLHVSPDVKNRLRQNVVHVYMVEDNAPLATYRLQEKEVYAICSCPIKELIRAHTQKGYSFVSEGLDNQGNKLDIKVTKDSFPYNWDDYHFKIALLANRFIKGEEYLIY